MMLVSILMLAQPAQVGAFELFGIKIFGGDEETDAEVVDPVPYSAELRVENDIPSLSEKLMDGSLLVRKQDQPPSGTIGLISRARDDESNLLALLFEEAYYGGTVSTSIGGRRPDQIGVTDTLRLVDGKVPVTVMVSPGPEFRFGDIRLLGGDPALAQAAATEGGLVPGDKAASRTIIEAEAAVVRTWQRAGHPFVKIAKREVIADHATRQLDVTLHIAPGPPARIGTARIKGTKRMSPEFLLRQAEVPAGDPYHPKTMERIRKNLTSLDALGSVSVKVAETPGPDGLYPVIIEVSERKRRT
ncbi:MAG: outer membrane protein assembly factor, partial [Rhizobiales bacterium]|nr:outer membrane protein assembly factor [Hyphomicrobiales bacterium]